MTLTGYAHPLNAVTGGSIDFMLHDDQHGEAVVDLVRLLHGDENPLGPGLVERTVAAGLPPKTRVGPQQTAKGSHAYVAAPAGLLTTDGLDRATVVAFIRPSIVGGIEQTILGNLDPQQSAGFSLSVSPDGTLTLLIVDGAERVELSLGKRLAPQCWYLVAASWDRSANKLRLTQKGLLNRWNSLVGTAPGYDLDDSTERTVASLPPVRGACFAVAASRDADGRVARLYNGKIDRHGILTSFADPALLAEIATGAVPPADSLLAWWDTTHGYTDRGIGDEIHDIGPHGLHASGVHRPIRAMTGWNWDGRNDSFRLAPDQYGGIAFHDDALIDCGWTPNLTLTLPEDLPSGVYALRVRKDGREDRVPFFVRPRTPRARIAVLMPTFTYLAYANEHLAFEAPIAQAICANTPVVTHDDLEWKAEETWGLSTYDVHSDYAGVCYSSWRRPIQNMRPNYRLPAVGVPWAFPADLSLIWWLETKGFEVDVITDHDLDAGGLDLLKPYRALLTGSHPEYYSLAMLDAVEDFVAEGGRLAYLGGNGFYWVTETRDDEPWCIEVRKLDTGSRAWQAAPGEGYLATTGDKSGVWRARGRAPQKLAALGFTAEGMDESQPFERLSDSFAPAARWIFEGIGTHELIGDFGLGLGGAAGIEIDRYELTLGTPPHTMLLASSFNHSDNYPLVSEEIGYAFPGRGGTQDPQVRADMAYYTSAGGGAVFAAGSIAWSQALPINGGDNNVGRILENVLKGFVEQDQLPPSG
ncbi:MAG: N,N-dimethylformamidase beta subunit family domain-containing protein [Polymorphobacter sp.]|uniref:N,N-dimethylformamidase beta subunit family domain-containing protein n=1 Tax=Polymorphobacter sp. TaxID=1909290 RepID=UPI003A85686A